MDKKKILGIALMIGAAIAVWYYFLRGKIGAAATNIAASAAGLGAADTAAYNQMLAIFKADANAGALGWLLPYVQQTLAGTNANRLDLVDYGINGQLSKAGAFIGEYSRAYHSNGIFKGKKPGDAGYEAARQEVNDSLYNVWNNFKSQYIQNAIAGQ